MSCEKDENIAFAEKMVSSLSMPTTIPTTGLSESRDWKWSRRGERCTKCFDMRFERTALYAQENGFPVISSSLGISRWKNMDQINDCGKRAAARYDNMEYWDYNWRKGGGSQRMIEISKREGFISRNIAAAFIPCVIPMPIAWLRVATESRSASSITALMTTSNPLEEKLQQFSQPPQPDGYSMVEVIAILVLSISVSTGSLQSFSSQPGNLLKISRKFPA